MAAYNETPPNTGDGLSAMSASDVRSLWQKTVDIYEQTEDFFEQFEGKTMSSPIWEKTETAKGAGQTMRITVRSGYYGEGKSGDALFETTADYEKVLINGYNLSVDWLRNATSHNERMEEVMGMRGEIVSGDAAELGKWMGRQKTARMMMLFRERGGTDNTMYAGGQLDENDIVSADGVNWDEIVKAKAQLEPLGGRPAKVGRVNGNDVYRYLVIGTIPGLHSLKTDPDYKQALREAGVRGEGNQLFEGGYVDVDGNFIKAYNPIDHDGRGPIGSAWNPKAFLGEAIVAGTASISVKGGGDADSAADTTKLYFKFFANYAFEFLPADILTAGTSTKYFLIVNPRSGSGGDGKIGMYSYTTGNNGNLIATVGRLGSAASGTRVTTLGDVTWDTGVWAGKHTDAHPVGATIIPCNEKGVPLGDTCILGAGSALRGYGKYRNQRTQEEVNGGFVTRRYISSVFGQALRKDRKLRVPGYLRLRHAVNYAGLGIPVVTS
jgi:hypothetical protein